MRFAPAYVAAALSIAACGGGGGGGLAGEPSVESIEPGFGPMGGGTRVVITGEGFLNGGAPPNRVVFGGRESPLAMALDDEHLEVVVPEADSPGEVDVVVFNSLGFTEAAGAFRYSDPPAISGLTPETVRYDQGATITIEGSGFVDEDAGPVTLLVNGDPALDVEVADDGTITFLAPPGLIFSRSQIRVINDRGEASNDGFIYGPGPQGGLVLFPSFFSTAYAYFFDPITLELQVIPRRNRGGGGPVTPGTFKAVFRNSNGDLLGVDRSDSKLYEIDLTEQVQTAVVQLNFKAPDITRVATSIYAMDRNAQRFGTLDLTTGIVTPLGGAIPCCSSFGLAADAGGNMFISTQSGITTISRTTGALGTFVPYNPVRHVSGMRFLGSQLYGVERNGPIFKINTTTGVTDTQVTIPEQISAMEVVQ